MLLESSKASACRACKISKFFLATCFALFQWTSCVVKTRQVKLWSADRGGPSPATSRLRVSCLKLSRNASKRFKKSECLLTTKLDILDTKGTASALTHLISWLWARSYQLLTQQHELWQTSVRKVLWQAQTRQHWMWQIDTNCGNTTSMAEHSCMMLLIAAFKLVIMAAIVLVF